MVSFSGIGKGIGKGISKASQSAIAKALRGLPGRVAKAVTKSIGDLKVQISKAARRTVVNDNILKPIAQNIDDVVPTLSKNIVDGSAGKVTKEAAEEMVEAGIKKGGKESIEEINQAFIKKISTEGIQLTTKKPHWNHFKLH